MSKALQQRARALAGRTALPTGEVRNFPNILANRLDALEAALAEAQAENARLTEVLHVSETRRMEAECGLAKAQEEMKLAIAHDRQPYPTAAAYEAACKALITTKAEREALEAAKLEALIAPVEVGGGIEVHLRQEIARLREALSALVELLDGQTEPLHPISWQVELEDAKRALAGGPR